jgi:hypothetical protein
LFVDVFDLTYFVLVFHCLIIFFVAQVLVMYGSDDPMYNVVLRKNAIKNEMHRPFLLLQYRRHFLPFVQ